MRRTIVYYSIVYCILWSSSSIQNTVINIVVPGEKMSNRVIEIRYSDSNREGGWVVPPSSNSNINSSIVYYDILC